MFKILKDLEALNTEDRDIYLGMIYDNDSYKMQFHSFLKTADTKLSDSFVTLFCGNYKVKLKRWIEGSESLDKIELSKTSDLLTSIFGKIEPKKKELAENSIIAKKETIANREVMKGINRSIDHLSDQRMGLENPPISKAIPENAEIIKLPNPEPNILKVGNIFDCILKRQSRKKFNDEPLNQDELSYLLWATQGVKKEFDHKRFSIRTVPSGGARHPFETYLAINNVDGLETGIYRYLPFSHSIVFLHKVVELESRLKQAANNQIFAGECAVSFIWTAIPYRTEWRYSTESKKTILQDSGYLSQNLYLACESIQCGTCAIGAYNQEKMDSIIQVDGEDEFTILLSPVGKYL